MSNNFAQSSWNEEDIKTLKPEWTNEQCHEFLASIERQLEETMIQAGWFLIQETIDL